MKRRPFERLRELTVTKLVTAWVVGLALFLWLLHVTGWGRGPQ